MKKIYNWRDHIRGEHTYHNFILNNLIDIKIEL